MSSLLNDTLIPAGLLRDYIRQKKADLIAGVMGGHCDSMEAYRASIGAYAELTDTETKIDEIVKEINGA